MMGDVHRVRGFGLLSRPSSAITKKAHVRSAFSGIETFEWESDVEMVAEAHASPAESPVAVPEPSSPRTLTEAAASTRSALTEALRGASFDAPPRCPLQRCASCDTDSFFEVDELAGERVCMTCGVVEPLDLSRADPCR